jgi:predicted NAD/FAD-binding protein
MKIAIVGTGVSGLVCGWMLHRDHDVTLFEADDYVGGHTHTVPVELAGRRFHVDTGSSSTTSGRTRRSPRSCGAWAWRPGRPR